jgi:hypothetical protein
VNASNPPAEAPIPTIGKEDPAGSSDERTDADGRVVRRAFAGVIVFRPRWPEFAFFRATDFGAEPRDEFFLRMPLSLWLVPAPS